MGGALAGERWPSKWGDVDTTAAMARAVSGGAIGLSSIAREAAQLVSDQGEHGFDALEMGELVANAGRPGTTSVSFIDTSTSSKREPPSASATVRVYLILILIPLRTVVDFGQPPGRDDEAQVYRGLHDVRRTAVHNLERAGVPRSAA
jgi:hypothetical protein